MKCYTPATALICLATPVLDENNAIAYGPVPDWAVESEPLEVPDQPAGILFIRKQDSLVRLDDAGQSNFVSQTFRILRPEALTLGNIIIAWDPSSDRPTVHKVMIHRDGETLDVLKSAQFEIVRQEDQLEQAMLTGRLTALLRVPDLRVGDDLELVTTTLSDNKAFAGQNFGLLFLGPEPPAGRYTLGLSWSPQQKPTIKLPAEFSAVAHQSDDSLRMAFDNPGPLNPPRNAPFRYSLSRTLQFSHFSSWQAVSKQVAGLFEPATRLQAQSPIQSEIDRIAEKHATPEARMQAALRLVQDQIRYVYVGLDGGNFRPATAEETWQRRYGDCKGKTVLLMALLKGLEIDAEAVLVDSSGNDDGLADRLPNPAMFNHVLVRARIGRKAFWLDGTLPSVYGPMANPLAPYRWVLPLAATGHQLLEIKPAPPTRPLEMGLFEIDATAGFDQPAKITNWIVSRGIDGLVQYQQLSVLTPTQLLSAFSNALARDPTWDSIETVAYTFDSATQTGVLTISGTGRPEWEKEGKGGYSLTLPGGGFVPPFKRQRPSDQDQSAPYANSNEYSCHVTTVRLPAATSTKNWSFNSFFDNMIFGRVYFRAMERGMDHTITMVRGARTEETEISPQKAQRDNDRIARFDNSKAQIMYDPDHILPVPDSGPRVPTLSERDWISDPSGCLPPDLASN